MKYIKIPILLFFGFIFFGCANNQVITKKDYKFEKLINESHLYSFEFHLENIDDSWKTYELITDLIYDGKSFDEYRDYAVEKFVQNSGIVDYPEILNDDGTKYIRHSDFDEKFTIEYNDAQYVIIKCELSFYVSGFAHGNYSINYYIIDIDEKRILEKSDLINQIPDEVINEFITSKYKINSFLRDNLWPADTINVVNGAAELIWNTYSITPYSDGIIQIEIPGQLAEKYLTGKGKELIKIR